MKEDILRVLNEELIEAGNKLEQAKRNNDLVAFLAYKKLIEIIGRLIRAIQDRG